ncbi:MAG TPA: hypothetical protein VN841_10545 [Bryobacteraceae bacterium]|nr:hypothetical protein [Bryobacteraceae bacterium]
MAWLIVTACDLATLVSGPASFPDVVFDMFTPILIWNVRIVNVLLLFVGLFAGDLLGRQIQLKTLRLSYNLVFLFAMTVAIDLITWGSPRSIEHFEWASGCVPTEPTPWWCVVGRPQPQR